MFNNSNYPPGVTGNEPQLTGAWPCPICNNDCSQEDPCWFCNNTGISPDDEPPCPGCGSIRTYFLQGIFDNLYEESSPGLLRQQMWYAAELAKLELTCRDEGVYCETCEKVSVG